MEISGDETALRNTNASVQTELRKKADDANARALKIAKAEGGLDALVKPKLKEIEQDTKRPKECHQKRKRRVRPSIRLNRAEKVLRGNLASDERRIKMLSPLNLDDVHARILTKAVRGMHFDV